MEKEKTTLAIRSCRQCGIEFMGGPRAWYCPECRLERKRAADRKCKQKIRQNGHSDRPLGSVDKCIACGKTYIVESARQKYCKDCAPEQYKIVDREQSRGWLERAIDKHGEKYRQEHLARKRDNWAKHNQKTVICPMCGSTFITNESNKKYCNTECADAGNRYNYAKYNYKKGKTKIEPKFSDYQKGGRLFHGNKNG